MPQFLYCICILWFAIGLHESTNHVEALWAMTLGTALNTTVFSTSERQVQPHFVKQVKRLLRCGCWNTASHRNTNKKRDAGVNMLFALQILLVTSS